MGWSSVTRPLHRIAGIGALASAVTVMAGSSSDAVATPSEIKASAGDMSLGFMTLPIYRAGAVPDEFTVLATPGNCGRHVQVTVSWNEEENWVRLHATGKHVLEPFPDVQRTEGVDYFPNPFWPEREDFQDGRYQLWMISTPDIATFYYDPVTLDLMGSEYDFPVPPPGAIPLRIPVFAAVPTPLFQPQPDGDLDLEVEWEYDNLVRPDLPQYAHVVGTFLPHTLCKADPFRYDRTSTRPYAITRPASEAKTWREMLANGIIFDMTVEPPEYFTDPPLTTMAGVYQGAVAIAGGIPKGWGLDLEAVFGSLAPPIRPLPTAPFPGEACTNWFKPKRDRDFDICGGGP
jgi:hypothetical protein